VPSFNQRKQNRPKTQTNISQQKSRNNTKTMRKRLTSRGWCESPQGRRVRLVVVAMVPAALVVVSDAVVVVLIVLRRRQLRGRLLLLVEARRRRLLLRGPFAEQVVLVVVQVDVQRGGRLEVEAAVPAVVHCAGHVTCGAAAVARSLGRHA
jgi:hypothetical protein